MATPYAVVGSIAGWLFYAYRRSAAKREAGGDDRTARSFGFESGGEWKMSEAAAIHVGVEPHESPLTPENWGKLGMWLFLAGDAMSFGCLIVGYGILRHASKNWPVPSAYWVSI